MHYNASNLPFDSVCHPEKRQWREQLSFKKETT